MGGGPEKYWIKIVGNGDSGDFFHGKKSLDWPPQLLMGESFMWNNLIYLKGGIFFYSCKEEDNFAKTWKMGHHLPAGTSMYTPSFLKRYSQACQYWIYLAYVTGGRPLLAWGHFYFIAYAQLFHFWIFLANMQSLFSCQYAFRQIYLGTSYFNKTIFFHLFLFLKCFTSI